MEEIEQNHFINLYVFHILEDFILRMKFFRVDFPLLHTRK
jgi:hypothetical protein